MPDPAAPSLPSPLRRWREGLLLLLGLAAVQYATLFVFGFLRLSLRDQVLSAAAASHGRLALGAWELPPQHQLLQPGPIALAYGTLLLGFWAAAWLGARRRHRRTRTEDLPASGGGLGWRFGLGALGAMTLFLVGVSRIYTLPPFLAFQLLLLCLVGLWAVLSPVQKQVALWQGAEAHRQRDLALQAQLAPHMLFNALSRLKGQIQEDPREAQLTVDRLAELHRELMDHVASPTVPLAREWALVEACLGLERARLGARLSVEMSLPEALEAAPIPPLALQVLVENAIRHGVDPLPGGGTVRIQALPEGRGVRLVVEDPGTGKGASGGTGRALALLRRRLPSPEDLRLEALPGGGHRATLLVRGA